MKKNKLIMTVATLCLAIAVLCFGVYAVQTVNYSLSGNITYEVTDAFVEINTKVYSSSTFMEQSELYNKIDEVLAGTYTGLTEESVNIPTYNSTNKDEVPEKELNLSFMSGATPKLAFFVVMNIKNLSDISVWANVKIPTLPNNVYQVNSGLESEITTNKNVVIALSLENQYKSVPTTAYTLGVQVGIDNNPISNFDFDSATKQISLKAGANPSGDLIIPSYINGTRVTKVGSFAGASATSIYVPTSVEQMTQYCFADCKNLTELSLPFTGAKNYETHGEAYSDTEGFQDDYPLNINHYFGNDAYYTSNSLTVDTDKLYLFFSDTDLGYLPKSLTTINMLYGCKILDYAFYSEGSDNLIEVINLPNSIVRMGEGVFDGCTSLTSITIPSSVTIIGNYLLNSCSKLERITVETGNRVYTSRDNAGNEVNCLIEKSSKTLIAGCKNSVIPTDGCVTSIGFCAFFCHTGLSSIEIPSSVTSIGESAFWGCTGLTSITIPDSVTSIDDSAFDSCTGLQNKDTANGLIYIKTTDNDYFAVYDTVDTNLTSCTINNSCKFILDSAFSNCNKLTSITIPSSVISIGNGAFTGCSGLMYDDTYNNLRYIKTTDNNYFALYDTVGTSLTSWTINNSCKFILDGAFSGCKNLSSIAIPSSVTSIERRAFEGCTSLTSIEIPSSVISVGDHVFNGCTGLDSITVDVANTVYTSRDNSDNEVNCLIEKSSKTLIAGCKNSVIPTDGSVTSIGEFAFEGCTGLTLITIPDSIKYIGSTAFYCCAGLSSIEIPSSVISIGSDVFTGCTGLTEIVNNSTSITAYDLPLISGKNWYKDDVVVTVINGVGTYICK